MGISNWMEDLKYLISKDNKSSRGFYLTLVIVLGILLVAGVALLVAAILGLTSGTWRIMGFAFLPAAVILAIALFVLLDKTT